MKHFHTLLALLASLVSSLVFSYIGVPLPFLFGPMSIYLVVSLFGFTPKGFPIVSETARGILGVAIGTSITVTLIAQIPALIMSMLCVQLFLIVVGLIGVPWFQRLFGFNFPTAYYSAMPGGLQDMVLFGEEAGGDPRALSLVHATRVLIIVMSAPIVLTVLFGIPLDQPLGLPIVEIPFHELVLMLFCAIAGWRAAHFIGLFGASILGPLILSAIFSLLGLIHSRPPQEAILFAQFFIGIGIGTKFVGITLREVRDFVLAGIGYTIILWVIAVLFMMFIVPQTTGSTADVLLAFAPGGQAEMTVLAIVSGADLSFVVLHHITRVVLVITGAPLIARLVFRFFPKRFH